MDQFFDDGIGERWRELAANGAEWRAAQYKNIDKAYAWAKCRRQDAQRCVTTARIKKRKREEANKEAATGAARRKRVLEVGTEHCEQKRSKRDVPEPRRRTWNPMGGRPMVTICGDSQLVTSWLNGKSRCKDAKYTSRVRALTDELCLGWRRGVFDLPDALSEPVEHIYREFNTLADEQANLAYDHGPSVKAHPLQPEHTCFRVTFDGARREGADYATAGWVMQSSKDGEAWSDVLTVATVLGPRTVVGAELDGAEDAIFAFLAVARGSDPEHIEFNEYCRLLKPHERPARPAIGG